jgi:hypothetical protein
MTTAAMLKRPSAFLPLLLASAAVLTILAHLVRFGPAPQADEGTAAHIWQLLMLLQLPAVGFFAVKWLPVAPRQALIVLVLQVAAVAVALAPVFLLRW